MLNAFPYIGGKHFSSKYIIPFFNYNVPVYIEVFGGSLSILLNKLLHKIEIVNDINDEITNFFIVLRDNLEEFLKRLDFVIFEEKFYKKIINNEFQEKDNIDKAINFYIKVGQSFAGNSYSFGYSFNKNEAKIFFNRNFKAISQRLKNVQILNKDYKEIFNSIKEKENFMIYLDPPYYDKEYYYKNSTFKKENHEFLAYLCNKLYDRHYFLISYYWFDKIEKFYPPSKWIYRK